MEVLFLTEVASASEGVNIQYIVKTVKKIK